MKDPYEWRDAPNQGLNNNIYVSQGKKKIRKQRKEKKTQVGVKLDLRI